METSSSSVGSSASSIWIQCRDVRGCATAGKSLCATEIKSYCATDGKLSLSSSKDNVVARSDDGGGGGGGDVDTK